MKKVFFIGLLFILPAMVFAQNETPTIDQRLYEVFEADFLERMQTQMPAMLEYYNYFLDHAYKIELLAEGKESDYSEVIIKDMENINILKVIKEQSLKRDYIHQSIYKIKNTNQLLILLSEKELAKKFNQATGRTY